MRKFIVLIFVLASCHVYGQSFEREASLAPVARDGFYNLLISPEISQHLNNDLSDIRIFDNQHKEVPYLLRVESPEYYAERFVEYEIVENQSKPRCCTSLMLRNASRTPINNIRLLIKNAEASREVSLLGSDDKKNWFSIKDNFILSAPQSTSATKEIEIVGFPWSNYEYYLLNIKDSTNAPLNILKAGYYEGQSSAGNFTTLPLNVNAYDSAKRTFVEITLNSLQILDKLEIDVSGVKYYRRHAVISEKRVRTEKNGKRTEYFSPIESFELTTGRKAIVELPHARAQHFRIEIANDDNPPLTISSIKAFQLNRYLAVWLTKDTPYTIQFGQPNLRPAVYDLSFFRDSIPKNIDIIEARDLKLLPTSSSAPAASFFTSKNIIWIAIVIVALVLGYMSIKLVRESANAKTRE